MTFTALNDASRLPLYTNIVYMMFVPLFLSSLLGFVAAAPAQEVQRRATDGTDGTVDSKIWIPILVIALLIFGISTVLCTKKKWLHRLSGVGSAAAAAGAGASTLSTGGGGAGMRELTADQLTGGNGSSNTLANTENNANGRTRRTRRPRRTPSQMSTTSLPAYMKEPGEQELVIFRGPADMEDVPIPAVIATVDIPRGGEDGDSEHSHREQYAAMPDSPHDMPLLQNDEPIDPASREALPQGQRALARRSVDTIPRHSDSDGSSLMRIDTTVTLDEPSDPRGSAPAYFEVVDPSQAPGSTMPVVATSPTNNDMITTTSTDPSNNNVQQAGNTNNSTVSSRRSTFRLANIFGGRSGTTRASIITPPGIPLTQTSSPSPENASAPGHGRSDSAGVLSLTSTLSRSISPISSNYNRSRSRLSTYNHRPSASTSSLLSLVNPLSRKKSSPNMADANNLTSPSLISLNSISAPLPHTLVKTEFTYPKTGPTPEQLKLISSRESMMRFGVPYGEEAVRWARSRTDLVDDGVPPPEFDAAIRPGSSGEASSSANAVAGSSDSTPESSTEQTSASNAPPEIRIDVPSMPPTPQIAGAVPASLLVALSPVGEVASPDSITKSDAEEDKDKVEDDVQQQDVQVDVAAPTSPASQPQLQSTSAEPASVPIPASPPTTSPVVASAPPPATAPAPVPIQVKHTPAPLAKTAAPPSSFRGPPVASDAPITPNTPNYARAESRASSFRSFATARESLNEFGERRPAAGATSTFGYDSHTMRSETPAESLYYSDAYGSESEVDSGDETETEIDDRRMTLRAPVQR
ncbi:hypothetical protein VNI00_004633 [Paramarasmius palmivorus]|uniref:Uncharacterized protein n=1 Tax=Paramarasmius palmivorus TaxID=297713 RepID=A0AAW0DKN7_9AGAR